MFNIFLHKLCKLYRINNLKLHKKMHKKAKTVCDIKNILLKQEKYFNKIVILLYIESLVFLGRRFKYCK